MLLHTPYPPHNPMSGRQARCLFASHALSAGSPSQHSPKNTTPSKPLDNLLNRFVFKFLAKLSIRHSSMTYLLTHWEPFREPTLNQGKTTARTRDKGKPRLPFSPSIANALEYLHQLGQCEHQDKKIP